MGDKPTVPELDLPPSRSCIPTPAPAPATPLALDHGPPSTRMHLGQELELDDDPAPIPLDLHPDTVRPPSSRAPRRVARKPEPKRRSGLLVSLSLIALLVASGVLFRRELTSLRGDLALSRGNPAEAKIHYRAALPLTRAQLGLARAQIASDELDAARATLDGIHDPSATAEVTRLRALTSNKPIKPK